MDLHNELLKALTEEYGDLQHEVTGVIHTYTLNTAYMDSETTMTIQYDVSEEKITVEVRYEEDFQTLVTDPNRAHKIRTYLEIFYPKSAVSTEDGALVMQAEYHFKNERFDDSLFFNKLSLIERIRFEVDDMIHTKLFNTDAYQDKLYRGEVYEQLFTE